jgi:hypothetical protein
LKEKSGTSKTKWILMDHERKFLLLWLYSASFVTVLRFFHAAYPEYDLGIQLEAAQNLLAGHGLSNYQPTGPDLADSTLVTLTWFPSGYSLCTAALMALGLNVGLAVKVLAAPATMLGWWGWGTYAYPFFSDGLKRNTLWRCIAVAIAVATPLLFSTPWIGTDIFLWATVPWVLLCVLKGADDTVPRHWRFDAIAGFLCGLVLLMRYLSLFLAVYAACVMFWQSRLRIKLFLPRLVAFGLGALPAFMLQFYVMYFLATLTPTPGGLSLNYPWGVIAKRLLDGLSLLHTANYPWIFWIPGKVRTILLPVSVDQIHWQLGITLIGFFVLAVTLGMFKVEFTAASTDPRILALGLFIALPLVLWGCTLLASYHYISDQRYYWPILPLSIFVIYWIASTTSMNTKHNVAAFVRGTSVVYITAYLAMIFVCITLLFVPGSIGATQRRKLIGTAFHPWPSMAVTHELSPARQFVKRLLKDQPQTLLLTTTPLFTWDPTVDRSRLRDMNCREDPSRYVTGPARIVILTRDEGQPLEMWYWSQEGRYERADCFERLPDLNLLERFPDEEFKVLETRLAAGQRVLLKP